MFFFATNDYFAAVYVRGTYEKNAFYCEEALNYGLDLYILYIGNVTRSIADITYLTSLF